VGTEVVYGSVASTSDQHIVVYRNTAFTPIVLFLVFRIYVLTQVDAARPVTPPAAASSTYSSATSPGYSSKRSSSGIRNSTSANSLYQHKEVLLELTAARVFSMPSDASESFNGSGHHRHYNSAATGTANSSGVTSGMSSGSTQHHWVKCQADADETDVSVTSCSSHDQLLAVAVSSMSQPCCSP
jgi:hypothetical protein